MYKTQRIKKGVWRYQRWILDNAAEQQIHFGCILTKNLESPKPIDQCVMKPRNNQMILDDSKVVIIVAFILILRNNNFAGVFYKQENVLSPLEIY